VQNSQHFQLGLFNGQLIDILEDQIFSEANNTYIWVEENTKEIINSSIKVKVTKSQDEDGSVTIPVQPLEVFTIAVGQSLQRPRGCPHPQRSGVGR
jgi:hypothetical protein